MIRDLRKALRSIPVLVEAVRQLEGSLHEALTGATAHDVLEERVRTIEGALHAVQAESEALVVRAESKLQSARAAEERTRRMMKRAQELEEEFADSDEESLEELRQWAEIFQGRDVEGSGEDGLHAVPSHVENASPPLEGKERAKAYKRGLI